MNRPMGKFALSSTPGCGKTTANNFIFKMASSEPFLHQKPILYQLEETFYHFRFDYVYIVDRMTAERIACRRDTFYVIDGNNAKPVHSKCLSLFISSPLNNTFKDWHYEAKVSPWYFPVWSLEELHNCRAYCYPNISVQDVLLRYKKYGGVARYVFCTDEKLPGIECAVADSDARKSLWSAGQPSQKFPMSHMLLHISVDTTLRFEHIILASRYVGRELFSKFFSETFELLKLLLGGGLLLVTCLNVTSTFYLKMVKGSNWYVDHFKVCYSAMHSSSTVHCGKSLISHLFPVRWRAVDAVGSFA